VASKAKRHAAVSEEAGPEAVAAVPDAAAAAVPVDGLADAAAPRLIPLRQLKLAAENVRRGGKADIEQLADDIAAHGLIQNLVAFSAGPRIPGGAEAGPDGEVLIVAGGRRLKALELLKRRGTIAGDYLVPVQIVDAEAARELSLAENFQRMAMNPADEAEAFHRLAQDPKSVPGAGGQTPAQIAARFGLTELHVKQRLRLAGLHPSVLAALKACKITLDVAKAFASVPDQARQAEVLKEAGSWALGNPDAIRREMRNKGIASDHFIASYVGEAAYLAAGGTIEADLFSDASTRLWVDGTLARELAGAKLALDAEAMRAEAGLGRVVFCIHAGGHYGQTRELIPYEFGGPLQDLPADVCAGLVGVVQLVAGDDGYAVELLDRAWLLDASVPVDPPADDPDEEDEEDEEEPDEPEPEPEAEPEGLKPLPAALRDALAMRRRDALALALLQDTQRARDVALFFLCELALRHERAADRRVDLGTALDIPYPGVADPVRDAPWSGDDPDALAAELADWAEFGHRQHPDAPPIDDSWRHLKTSADRFAAFIELPGEERAHWAALALGRTLTAHGGAAMKDAIAASLGLTEVSPILWRPTAENYFDRAGKARCLAFLETCCGAADFPALPDWRKLKKADLSALCAQLAAGDAAPIAAALKMPPNYALVLRIVCRFKAWMPDELMFGGAK
jgi:ParB family chromosome partitioning protein